MKIETVAISKLVFDPANARKHDKKNLEAIKGSLARFGQQKPIVVGKNNVVIAGNGTIAAALEIGWTMINIVRTDLTGSEATAFALADNRTAELASWDVEILGKTLQALHEDGFNIDEIGFDTSKLFQDEGDTTTVSGTTTITGSKELSESDFQEFDHQCPKCGFEFNDNK